MKLRIRKLITVLEDTCREMNRDVEPIVRKCAAIAVIENPCADKFEYDLDVLTNYGEKLGELLGRRAVNALGIDPTSIQSYGKAAIVGAAGELEHAAAILHPRMGKPLRAEVEKGAALVPSAKKMGGQGTTIDVPLGHKDAAYVRSHFDAMEVRVHDAPRRNEILVAIAVSDAGRPFPRVGGLTHDEAIGQDGLR